MPVAAQAEAPREKGAERRNIPSSSPAGLLEEALLQLSAQLEGSIRINSVSTSGPLPPPGWNNLLRGASPVLTPALPLAYATCTSKADVVACVSFAVKHKLKVHAKGSGHHYGGAYLPHGGLVLDMSGMKALTVDAASRTAVLQPGVTTREVRDACAPHGLHFPGGHITDVGCSGFILGGGYGWGVTAFGAAADNVTAFEVVEMMTSGDDEDVRCSLRRVTAESDADLFAGLKGGGQFLAVVTEFTVALHPVPAALPCITAAYPLAAARDVAAAYQRLLLGAAPPSVEASLVWKLGRDPPHEPIALISAVGFAPAGTPDLEACYDVLRTLLPQQRLFLDDGPPLPYLEALSQLDGNWAFPGVCCYSHAMHISPKDLTSSDVIAALERHTAGMTSDRSYILCAPSAPRSTAGGASALGFRGTMILTPYALWPRTQGGPEEDRDQQHCDWVQSFRSAVAPRVLGCYLNEVMQDGRSGPSSGCFEPATFALLQRLKAQHDPLGLLKDLT